ncbi:hypothetical protein D0T51_01465 [Parabacteroides sp. 52]|uniref:hypothetical protein n=1 Tax=unclassified Parabacteroides TaxID=2649774 RepID=UPI0013D46A31|nr:MULTISPECIES: hypothetical protein [unclassified Parabacteroides]MDH6533651.1 hypothetical protein [Parabacteroides sp. PM5-20]NDV54403.1 hypothetical protein [Parabacteroides sp. 52]
MKAKPYKMKETEQPKVKDQEVLYLQELETLGKQSDWSPIVSEDTISIVMKNREKLRETIEISRKQKEAGLGIDQEELRNRPLRWRKGE